MIKLNDLNSLVSGLKNIGFISVKYKIISETRVIVEYDNCKKVFFTNHQIECFKTSLNI